MQTFAFTDSDGHWQPDDEMALQSRDVSAANVGQQDRNGRLFRIHVLTVHGEWPVQGLPGPLQHLVLYHSASVRAGSDHSYASHTAFRVGWPERPRERGRGEYLEVELLHTNWFILLSLPLLKFNKQLSIGIKLINWLNWMHCLVERRLTMMSIHPSNLRPKMHSKYGVIFIANIHSVTV